MLLKQISITFLFCAFIGSSYAQTFETFVTHKETPDKLVTNLTAEELSSDNFKIYVCLAAPQDSINDIGTYRINEKMYINGKLANSSGLWASYKKSSDAKSSDVFYKKPSLRVKLNIAELIKDNAHLVKQKGNTLKIEFVHDKQNDRILGTSEIKFDVPGFKDPKSDFCRLLERKCDDDKIEKTIHTMFKLMYPHSEILMTLTDKRERKFKDYHGNPKESSKTYMLIYKYKGAIWSLKYSGSYVLEDGEVYMTPRVKIYNGLDDPIQVSESCWNSLKSTLD